MSSLPDSRELRFLSRLAGRRRLVLVAFALGGLLAAHALELRLADLVPGAGGVAVAGEFFSGAIHPAWSHQARFVPSGTPPLLGLALMAAGRTVTFAAAAVGLSVLCGLALGFLSSSSWWGDDPVARRNAAGRLLRRWLAPALQGAARVVAALMRSTHELLWAVLFLSAVGWSDAAAVLAITIPYSGTFAKVFSEMIDEAPRDGARALRGLGASPLQVFAVGLLPRALPDLLAYSLYRFECGLRSATVLGFFGIETLGYHISQSFANAYYREVWTYLYTLFLLVVVLDWWSGLVRRRLVA